MQMHCPNNCSSSLFSKPDFEPTGDWSEVKSSAFPATSIYRSNWGTAAGRNSSYAYAISNHSYGYLESARIAVQPNTSYDLSAYLRGGIDPDDSMGLWRLRVRFHDASGSLLSNFSEVTFGSPGSLTTSWAQKSGSFTTPDNAASVSVWLMNYMNSGWVAFDDVSLAAAPGVKTTSYFYAGGQRVAMRRSDGVSSTVSYIVGDHLGSATILADASGNKIGEMLYRPWGELRYSWGSLPTEQRFTGQRRESALGLYDYGARFYDPALGRFITADSIVPGAGNSQAWDRFAYVVNNPVRMVDPSGHVYSGTPMIDGVRSTDFGFTPPEYEPENPYMEDPPDDTVAHGPAYTMLDQYLLAIAIFAETSNGSYSSNLALMYIAWTFINRVDLGLYASLKAAVGPGQNAWLSALTQDKKHVYRDPETKERYVEIYEAPFPMPEPYGSMSSAGLLDFLRDMASQLGNKMGWNRSFKTAGEALQRRYENGRAADPTGGVTHFSASSNAASLHRSDEIRSRADGYSGTILEGIKSRVLGHTTNLYFHNWPTVCPAYGCY